MKKFVAIIAVLSLSVPFQAFAQRFEKQLALYNNTLSVVNDTQLVAVGFNAQLNNLLLFDGNTMQAAIRYRLPNSYLRKSTEIGVNINGYFNKSFRAQFSHFGNTPHSLSENRARAGYSLRASVNRKIKTGNNEFQFGFSPLIYIYNQYYESKKYDLGGTIDVFFRKKNFQFWTSISRRPETRYVVYPCLNAASSYPISVKCTPEHSRHPLDTTRVYYFNTYSRTAYNINFSYTFISDRNFKTKPYISFFRGIDTYNFMGYPAIAGGIILEQAKFSVTPEIVISPYWEDIIDANGNYLGTKIKYKIFQYGVLTNYDITKNTRFLLSITKVGYRNSYFDDWQYYLHYQVNVGLIHNF